MFCYILFNNIRIKSHFTPSYSKSPTPTFLRIILSKFSSLLSVNLRMKFLMLTSFFRFTFFTPAPAFFGSVFPIICSNRKHSITTFTGEIYTFFSVTFTTLFCPNGFRITTSTYFHGNIYRSKLTKLKNLTLFLQI